jgi:uncharacterized circularly permuted ATP-grasp superfamily protein
MQMLTAERIYVPEGFYDEALTADGIPRPDYARVLEALARDPAGALEAARRRAHELGASFGEGKGAHPFKVDPVPRIVGSDEWEGLEAALAQRARALNAFVADAYGERAIVGAGVIPKHLIEGADHFDPALAGADLGLAPVTVAGFDLVRGLDGVFRVLEDNVRTPSGIAYARAARLACDPWLGYRIESRRRPFDDFFDALRDAIAQAAPDGHDGCAVLLSDGPENFAWYEHRLIGEAIGIPVAQRHELRLRGGELWTYGDSARRVTVVLRRTDEDRLHDEDGEPTWLGELLLEPIRRGTLRVANAFGAGVADDKLSHAYVEPMIRFYLDEEPLIESVRTHDLIAEESRARARERLRELVVKPRGSYGGRGVVIGTQADPDELKRIGRLIDESPAGYVAQEIVELSRHPTVCRDRLEPRHVDLRAFAVCSPSAVRVVPGGLTRFAAERGSLLVNSSQGGGGKDTWVLG